MAARATALLRLAPRAPAAARPAFRALSSAAPAPEDAMRAKLTAALKPTLCDVRDTSGGACAVVCCT
jgi:hypothetical protein